MRTKKRLLKLGLKKTDSEEEEESSDEEAQAVEELLREELGGSEESDYDSEDIPLGAKDWKGKGDKSGDSSSESGSDSDSNADDENVTGGQVETKEVDLGDEGGSGEWVNDQYDQLGGYDESGYDQSGYDQSGYDQSGYDQSGYDQSGYAADDQTGSDEAWEQVYDEGSERYYWYNSSTGETKWD